jgi:hypothetical protein
MTSLVALALTTGRLGSFAPSLATPIGFWIVQVALLVVLTFSLSHLFTAGESDERRAALPRAVAHSLVYLLLMEVVLVEVPAVDLLGLVTAAAVGMDLVLELRFHAAHGELVAIRRVQKPDRADDLVDRLRTHGMPAVAQGAYHRTLLQFFGPFVPVDVLVPAARAAEAAAALDGP